MLIVVGGVPERAGNGGALVEREGEGLLGGTLAGG